MTIEAINFRIDLSRIHETCKTPPRLKQELIIEALRIIERGIAYTGDQIFRTEQTEMKHSLGVSKLYPEGLAILTLQIEQGKPDISGREMSTI